MSNLLSPIDIITRAELQYSACLTREATASFFETKLQRTLRPPSSRIDFAYPQPPLICLVSHISRYRSAASPSMQAKGLILAMVGNLNILPSEYHILSSRSASTGNIPRAAQALKDKRDDLCKAVPSLLHVRDELRKCEFECICLPLLARC